MPSLDSLDSFLFSLSSEFSSPFGFFIQIQVGFPFLHYSLFYIFNFFYFFLSHVSTLFFCNSICKTETHQTALYIRTQCIYVMYTNMHICICARAHACVYIHIYMYVCMYEIYNLDAF